MTAADKGTMNRGGIGISTADQKLGEQREAGSTDRGRDSDP